MNRVLDFLSEVKSDVVEIAGDYFDRLSQSISGDSSVDSKQQSIVAKRLVKKGKTKERNDIVAFAMERMDGLQQDHIGLYVPIENINLTTLRRAIKSKKSVAEVIDDLWLPFVSIENAWRDSDKKIKKLEKEIKQMNKLYQDFLDIDFSSYKKD